ncbi:MAG: hypothetical protein AB7U98_08075 [Candidatus Nitrosocosmicus sp.]
MSIISDGMTVDFTNMELIIEKMETVFKSKEQYVLQFWKSSKQYFNPYLKVGKDSETIIRKLKW